MINIGICDDQPASVYEINTLIKSSKYSDRFRIYTYTSPTQMIKCIKEISFDIVFMDIKLNQHINGLELARYIKNSQYHTLIIYVSAYTCYLPDMVQCEPFRFLTKPINHVRFFAVLESAYKRVIASKEKYYYYSNNGALHKINLDQVQYFSSAHRKIIAKSIDSEFEFYGKLDNVEKDSALIYPFFIRTGKSYLVNLKYIRSFTSSKLYVGNDEIPIGRNYMKSVKKKIFDSINEYDLINY